MEGERQEIQPEDLGKGLHLAHLNVRSLLGSNKVDLIKNQIRNSGYDIFTLSETWLSKIVPDPLVNIPNYTVSRLDRSWGGSNEENPKRGGGLLCYLKEGINFSDSKLEKLNMSSKDIEMQWLLVSLSNVRPIVIVNVYRPPSGDYKKCCELLLESFNNAALADNTDYFVMGDFNINLNDKKTPEARELVFTMNSLGLRQLIDKPTRTSFKNGRVSETRIDLIFSNSELVQNARVLDLNLSDHSAVAVTRKKVAQAKLKVEFKGRSYRNYNKEDFQNRLTGHNWEGFYEERDPGNLWHIMEELITREIDEMCAMKSYRVAEKREPWLTNEALEAIKDKDRIMARAKRTGKEEDWSLAKRERNRVGRELELLRRDYLKNQQEEHKSDPKEFWKVISTIIPGKKVKGGKIWLKKETNGEEVPVKETADYINNFFTNIGPELAKQHSEPWAYFGNTIQDDIPEIVATQEEVAGLCRDINTMKSSGLERLSSRICKDAFVVLTEELTHIFNCSLSSATFPVTWKSATVVPLYKGGDKNEVGNYRPVSLLPIPGKLLERIVHNRIYNFFDIHEFLSEHQGGFRKGHSTVATIADLTDDLFEQVNLGMTTLAAFIDLKKAFDTVNLGILARKLEKSGVRGRALEWCKNYLSGRSQRTMANGEVSGSRRVTCGVPQGSVLGPLFFLIYVNDLHYVLDDCKLKLYADDTVLYQSGADKAQAEQKLQASLNKFSKWCSANVLTINTKKTKVMTFGSRSKVKKCKGVRIMLKGEALKLVPTYKYLGFILDATLGYNKHIASILRCVQHKLYILGKVRRFMNKNTALKIYKTMMLPYYDYADVIFHNANNADLSKLQRLQNRALKTCLGRDRVIDAERAHRQAVVPFLQDRREAHVLNFMYMRKIKKPGLLNVREIRTRAHDAPLFEVKIPRCEAFKRSVQYAGSVLWNGTAPQIRNIQNYLQFKEVQKKTMLAPLMLIQA